MKIFTLLALLFLTGAADAQSSAPGNDVTAYKDVKFGCRVEDCMDKMRLQDTDGDGLYFTINNRDYLKIGTYRFDKGRAAFPYGGLLGITLEAKWNIETYDKFIRFMSAQFGPPDQEKESVRWSGSGLEYALFRNPQNGVVWMKIMDVE